MFFELKWKGLHSCGTVLSKFSVVSESLAWCLRRWVVIRPSSHYALFRMFKLFFLPLKKAVRIYFRVNLCECEKPCGVIVGADVTFLIFCKSKNSTDPHGRIDANWYDVRMYLWFYVWLLFLLILVWLYVGPNSCIYSVTVRQERTVDPQISQHQKLPHEQLTVSHHYHLDSNSERDCF